MSRTYWFHMIFDLEFNSENIEKILKKGSRKGFLYYTFDSILKKTGKNFTDQEASRYLLHLYECVDDESLYIKISRYGHQCQNL